MLKFKTQPVGSIENLRGRVERLVREPVEKLHKTNQLSLDLPYANNTVLIDHPSKSIASFLDFVTDAIPDGDVYLFGGVLRDLAIFGRKGFNSDIDLVVEGDWTQFVSYLESLNAFKNKFGGYRLTIGGWPVDIWNARETWAIKQGLVQYKGIASLTETTVLNWDAILMNWRTRNFIYREKYFEEITERILDVVLEENPSPRGMAVRVFRHFYFKGAEKITKRAAAYLSICAKKYSFEEIKYAEVRSYSNTLIKPAVYKFFKNIDVSKDQDLEEQFIVVGNLIMKELDIH
ncbi:MAG: hypothetical protein RRB22_15400 [Gammaproteobacteria bacterium]|nr:hypothetical protein [Gammaproteobacteria bacterium]